MLKSICRIILIGYFALPLSLASATGITLAALDDAAGVRKAAVCGNATEMHLPAEQSYANWILDPSIFNEDQGDVVERRQVFEPEVTTVKLANLIPPIRFQEGEADIPDNYLLQLRDILEKMRGKNNVRLHFVGHADTQPLSPELETLYEDNQGLSRERAGTTAEFCQQSLGLPPAAISYEGVGDTQPLAANDNEAGRARNRRVEVEVWYDEIGEKLVDKEVIVPRQVNRVKVCRAETVCKLRYRDGHNHRARVRNLVAPLYYEEGHPAVTDSFLQQIRQSLNNLADKQNVIVKFIAFTDSVPLAGREQRIYGDHQGLSRAISRRVAVAVQEALALQSDVVESAGGGIQRPAASNDTPRGRALNRRIEVEFWYDDPLQELPDEPQICPDVTGTETATRRYHSPAGAVPPILFRGGDPVLPAASIDRMQGILTEINGKPNVRIRFVGYTSNRILDRRVAKIYGDDIGWSTARARRVMEVVADRIGLASSQVEVEGRGYVQSEDVINSGFVESEISRVEVQFVYDEEVEREDFEGVEITPLTRDVRSSNPFALNLMRISVDGVSVDDPRKSIPDVQRCTDLALEDARVQFKHDTLNFEPRLNVTAWPRTITLLNAEETPFSENRVMFRMYSNYRSYLARSEVRIFRAGQSVRDNPLALVELDGNGRGEWLADPGGLSAPETLNYVLRVYDPEGRFDETDPQPLWLVNQLASELTASEPETELLAGYGESRISRRNIPLRGGTVQASGRDIPPGYSVWLAGHRVPVDNAGKFIAEEILPEGLHTVEVAILDPAGNGDLFLRDLSLDRSDWFTVGIADLTLSGNKTNGPAKLLKEDKPQYSDDFNVNGRLGFYTKGKFGPGWDLTASADTREAPLDEIFSNFLDKRPESLLRRLDPDDHYPTFGDDGTVVEDAPTSGKFYVRLQKDRNYGLWGNFKVGYLENSLAQVDRGLYGLNLHYQTETTTSFGEPRMMVDGFAADPGTVPGRDELRGTGGSLYYLRHQDILNGSERLRIEIRDKDSGVVLGTKDLTAVLDYDIDYLQGRILLASPLSATADDGLLVSDGSISGNPLYLVARYEFTPGLDDPDLLTTGGRADYWFGDHVKFGVTASSSKEAGDTGTLHGGDLTLRKSAGTWLRLETGRSDGPGFTESNSTDGGYSYESSDAESSADDDARAYRADLSLDFRDVLSGGAGRMTFYGEEQEAGYSAPGYLTATDTRRFGGTLDLPVGKQVAIRLKGDRTVQDDALETDAAELDLDYRMTRNWTLSGGLRHDRREDDSSDQPATQEEGKRTDAVARLLFDSQARWTAYGFVQESLETDGNREENGRIGAGGSYQLTNRFKLDAEVSDGDLGSAGRLGTEYLYSDRSTMYLNYSIENERSDNGLRARRGNLTSGFRNRYSDSVSVYLEERYDYGDIPTGLTHSAGVDLTPTDRLNIGANVEIGKLRDHETSAETKRKAAGLSAGYGFERLKIATALEYRKDDAEQADLSQTSRTTWLFKNNFKFHVTPDWNLIGKFNYSWSDSSLGRSYDGKFIEAVLGYAYRPVDNDRLNALVKYTYFYDIPSADQLDPSGTTSSGVLQKSHIASVDVMYELSERWTVGGKYGYRHGEVSLDRVDRDFFSSQAHLYVVRADWHFIHRWDALVEGRLLDLPDAEDRLSGILVALYRHLGNHVKLGVGYNFSDFSDDLTNYDYDHQGVFVNLIGKY